MGLRASVRSWSARTSPRPVVLSSPYPVEECLRRLAQVTTKRTTTSWYLDTKTTVLPNPRFWGDISPSGITIVEFEDASERAVSYSPQLCVRPEPAADGGTTLTGTIGMEPYKKDVIRVMTVGACLMGLVGIGVGIAILVGGNLTGLLLVLVLPLMVGGFVGFSVQGLPFLEEHIAKLIGDVNKTLGSTCLQE